MRWVQQFVFRMVHLTALFGAMYSMAYGQIPPRITVEINTEKLRIGDSVAEPVPVGLTWEKAFEVPEPPKWATLSVEASDSSYENVVALNGQRIGILNPVPSGQWLPTVLSIAPPLLKAGTNTLEVRSVAKRNNYDDLYVRSVVLTLGYTDPPAIRSLSRVGATAGSTITLTGERMDPEDGQVLLGESVIPALFTSPTQAVFRIPSALSPGSYPLSLRTGGTRSAPIEFTILPGDTVYEPLSQSSCPDVGLPGDVSPRPGSGGRLFGDGQVNLADAIRILRRVLGLEPDPWP